MDNKKISKKQIITYVVLGVILIACILICVFAKSIFGEDSTIASQLTGLFNFADSWQEVLRRHLTSLISVIIFIAVAEIIRWILRFTLSKIKKARSIASLADSFIKYLFAIIIVFRVLNIWGVDTVTLIAGLGIIALVVGLGAQQIIADVLAGISIVFEHYFEVGDIIIVDGFRGKVQSIGIRNTKIEDVGGDVKVINNSAIATLVNQTKEFSVASCDMSIEYEESLEKVELIIKNNLPELQKKIPLIVEGPFYKGVSELADSSVNLKFIAKCKEEDKYQVQRDMTRELYLMFNKNNINIPYNQIVVNEPTDTVAKQSSAKMVNQAKEFVEGQKEASKSLGETENNA